MVETENANKNEVSITIEDWNVHLSLKLIFKLMFDKKTFLYFYMQTRLSFIY